MPKVSLLKRTLTLLARDRRNNMELARASELGYFWITRLRRGEIKEPSVVKIEKLYETLSRRQ